MLLLTAFIFVIILGLVWRCDKSFANPVTVTISLWLFLIVLYEFANHDLFPLSDRFYVALLLWCCPFSAAYFLLLAFPVNSRPHVGHHLSSFLFKRWFLILFALALLAQLALKFNEVRQFGFDNFFQTLRVINVDNANGLGEHSFIEVNINRITQFCYVLWFIYAYHEFNFKFKHLFYTLIILSILLGANKFSLARFLLGLFVVYNAKHHFGLMKLLAGTLVIIALMVILNFTRNSETFELIDWMQQYFLSPLPAFDSFVLHSSSTSLFTTTQFGEYLFTELYGKLEINPGYFENENIVYVPILTNVFTAMVAYFVDFRYNGLLFGSLFWGVFFSYIYIRSKKNEMFLIMYACFFHVLILQFFVDFLITSHSRFNILLILVLIFVFYTPLKFNNKVK